MTQGRNPPPERDEASTLFEPSKESPGQIAEQTPSSGTTAPDNGGLNTDQATPAYGSGSQAGSMGDGSMGDLLSASGASYAFDGSSSLQPGQVLFGRYIVVKKVGEGGMGTVWLVRHRELDSDRALKLIVSGIARDPQARARFRREARILDKLNHPNAVRVYNAEVLRDVAFIEMEFVRGESLNQVLVHGVPMPLSQVVDLLEQLCLVLQAANDEGIIHRDLKPPNMMLVDGRQPGQKVLKLLDFGIAKIREGGDDVRTMTGSFMGTPLYSSPEQIVGGLVDARSDIYSVGLILYEMLTGHRPFEGSLNAIIYKHTMVQPPTFAERNPNASVPRQVEEVVFKCLAKEPNERPQSPNELVDLFRRAIALASTDCNIDQAKFLNLAPATDSLATPKSVRVPVDHTTLHRVLYVTVGLLALVFLTIMVYRLPGSGGTAPSGPSAISKDPIVVGVPKPVVTASPAQIDEVVNRWKSQGYTVDEAKGRSGGWPLVLLRPGEDNDVEFQRQASGIYLPEGYTPSDARDPLTGYPLILVRGDGAKFAWIAGGEFKMGCLKNPCADNTRPAHLVALSGFYMQTTEVTNGEIERHLGERVTQDCDDWRERFSRLSSGEGGIGAELARKHPAVDVPWRVADLYALDKKGRLPTEAQWEFAARSRGKAFNFVSEHEGAAAPPGVPGNIDRRLTYTAKVGSFGDDVTVQRIFDLSGNVREWCRDRYQPYQKSDKAALDPSVPLESPGSPSEVAMVVRGGSFLSEAGLGETTNRDEPIAKDSVTHDLGFRIVIECPQGPPDIR